MSDTPRTDRQIYPDSLPEFDDGHAVSAAFARELERELIAVTKQRDELNHELERIKAVEWWI